MRFIQVDQRFIFHRQCWMGIYLTDIILNLIPLFGGGGLNWQSINIGNVYRDVIVCVVDICEFLTITIKAFLYMPYHQNICWDFQKTYIYIYIGSGCGRVV